MQASHTRNSQHTEDSNVLHDLKESVLCLPWYCGHFLWLQRLLKAMSKQSHLYFPVHISSQELKRIWESAGCATDVLFLHTAQILQKTNIPYLHTNIPLKAHLGGEGQKLHKGYIYCIEEKLLSGPDLTLSQNTFLSLTHIPLQGFSAWGVVICHWWPWQHCSTLTF